MRDQFRRSPPLTRPVLPASTMPPDKQTQGTPAKPITPTLSAAFRSKKHVNPLIPRLAGNAVFSTPRRLAQSETTSPLSVKEEGSSTPIYLSANVTPRSGPRTLRRDGATTSPENTPTGLRQPVLQGSRSSPTSSSDKLRPDRSPVCGGAKPEQPLKSAASKGVICDSLSSRAPSRPESSCDSPTGSPMFFRADDTRSSASSCELDVRSQCKSTQNSQFFYADGTQETVHQINETTLAIPALQRRSTGPPRPSSAITARLQTPPLSILEAQVLSGTKLQSNSQNFSASGPKLPYPISTCTVPEPTREIIRPQQPSHRKSCSVDSKSQILFSQNNHRTNALPALAPPPLQLDAADLKLGTSPELSAPIVSKSAESMNRPESPRPRVHSPVRTDGSSSSHIDETALNARTARKVLDLEISNSSLLAINRTLEREMRKQTAELRRYRRLSRSARLSVPGSIRSVSGGGLSFLSETDGISELSSIPSEDDVSGISDDDESSVADEGTLSPNSLAQHDARHRATDEKRFMLDLAKHQELLIDSQKMNQSLKRCLGWTEELIKEAKKALEYQVRVSDVEIGGRVLAPDELDEEF